MARHNVNYELKGDCPKIKNLHVICFTRKPESFKHPYNIILVIKLLFKLIIMHWNAMISRYSLI